MRIHRLTVILWSLCLVPVLLVAGAAGAAPEAGAGPAEKPAAAASQPGRATGLRYEDDSLSVRMVMRTPDQLRAFYIGRGFNQAAIDEILATCFMTPIVHNKTLDVLWLRLDDWRFSRGAERIARLGRDYWPPRWEATGLAQAHRSTFGWTLLPEERDLRPDESAGGSVVIARQAEPFTLTMRFHTGADAAGPLKTVIFEDLECTNSP
jgi:hypothetical protein